MGAFVHLGSHAGRALAHHDVAVARRHVGATVRGLERNPRWCYPRSEGMPWARRDEQRRGWPVARASKSPATEAQGGPVPEAAAQLPRAAVACVPSVVAAMTTTKMTTRRDQSEHSHPPGDDQCGRNERSEHSLPASHVIAGWGRR